MTDGNDGAERLVSLDTMGVDHVTCIYTSTIDCSHPASSSLTFRRSLMADDDYLEPLQVARKAAEESEGGYDSESMRTVVIERFKTAFNGRAPYEWQVDVTEALLLERDVVVIASTGAGKTMPFCMPLLIDETKTKKVLIISPLNELEEEQVSVEPKKFFSSYLKDLSGREI